MQHHQPRIQSVEADAVSGLELLQELEDLHAYPRLVLPARIQAVEKYDCHGRPRLLDSETTDLLRLAIIENRKITLTEARHGMAVIVFDNYIHLDHMCGYVENVRSFRALARLALARCTEGWEHDKQRQTDRFLHELQRLHDAEL